MTRWQRQARLLIAAGAVAFAVVVAFAFKGRAPAPPAPAGAGPSDPNAVLETAGAQTLRLNRDKEQVRIDYRELRSYPGGATMLSGVTVVTERGGGRTFTVTANQAEVGPGESTYDMSGDVQVVASDGMVVKTERGSYNTEGGVVRAPGPMTFARGRMTGSGIGLTYEKNRDFLQVLDAVRVRVAPGAAGAAALEITAPTADLDRTQHVIHFPRGMKASRGGDTVEAATAVARLTPDEDRLQTVELRGGSRITSSPASAGGLQALSGRDINLRYAASGPSVEHAVVVGEAVMQLAGEGERPGGRIAANSIDLTLAPDGTTPIALAARDEVVLALPPQENGAARSIRARTLDSEGAAGRGLTRARFTGSVQFQERGPSLDRSARSQTLDVALPAGLATLDDAMFGGGVRFGERDLLASGGTARYQVAKGSLELRGTGADAPRVVNDHIAVTAERIDVTLDGPVLAAHGAVESLLKPRRKAARAGEDTRLPSILDEEQPVVVTAGELQYDGRASRATYGGGAQLVQGSTSIKAASLGLDDKTGDLTATGAVTTTIMLDETEGDQPPRRVRTTATANEFKYEEAVRRATYTGDAHLTGPQGDMTAATIVLHLKPSGDELEAVEAEGGVTLRDKRRKTTGSHMKYVSADQRYEVTGAPVTIVDECGRETTGKTLTLFRGTDRIVVDGNEQMRTQTRGATSCP